MARAGVATCAYANLFEFGWNVTADLEVPPECTGPQPSPTSTQGACHQHARCESVRALHDRFENGIIRDWQTNEMLPPKGCLGQPCAMMDPADEEYSKHLLAMTAAAMRVAPFAGLCIDRQDMVGRLNPNADDGVTWFASTSKGLRGGKARNTLFSFLNVTGRMGEQLHPNGKSIMINVHTSRLDMMRHVDGIFDEHGDIRANIALSGLLGLAMPVIIWNHGTLTHLDTFLQTHLHYGCQPMVPVPNNDHSIHTTSADATFEAYAPLFAQLKGKEWVLTAHAATTSGAVAARANLFRVDNCSYTATVTLAAMNQTGNVTLRLRLPDMPSRLRVRGLWPQKGHQLRTLSWIMEQQEDVLVVEAPLHRGCVLVLIDEAPTAHLPVANFAHVPVATWCGNYSGPLSPTANEVFATRPFVVFEKDMAQAAQPVNAFEELKIANAAAAVRAASRKLRPEGPTTQVYMYSTVGSLLPHYAMTRYFLTRQELLLHDDHGQLVTTAFGSQNGTYHVPWVDFGQVGAARAWVEQLYQWVGNRSVDGIALDGNPFDDEWLKPVHGTPGVLQNVTDRVRRANFLAGVNASQRELGRRIARAGAPPPISNGFT